MARGEPTVPGDDSWAHSMNRLADGIEHPDTRRIPAPVKAFPDKIDSETGLEAVLADPSEVLIEFAREIEGDLLILGAGGKMGPSLARLAANALRAAGLKGVVHAVSRFPDGVARVHLEEAGVRTLACDLLDEDAVCALPRCPNVVFMAGRKFGAPGSDAMTWALNTVVPAHVARTFTHSRIVVFSTGNVYPSVPPDSRGCTEDTPPDPVGEYAASCLGRERVFQYYAERFGTPSILFRLNYAVDLRYGVLIDIARKVLDRQPVGLSVSAFNVIWQGDANERALLSLGLAANPPAVLNVTGPEVLRVEDVARRFGKIFDVPVRLRGRDAGRAFLSDASRSIEHFGPPRVSADRLIPWVAEWLRCGGPTLDKPTMFEVTDGRYLR